jgi:pyrimidine deaminase RibD-like protein
MPICTNDFANPDQYWMQRTLELARRGIGLCSPNPVVGCVILDRAGQVPQVSILRPGRPRIPTRLWAH